MSETDLLDTAAGLPPGSRVAVLRRQRPDFVRYSQGSHDVLIAPAEPGGVSLIERAAAALRVAEIERDPVLTDYYRRRLHDAGGDDPTQAAPRLAAILRHVALVAATPGAASKVDLDALRNAGLQPRDIVTITQIVAFVSYQVRVVAGLRLLSEEVGA